jgi:hypothetical protein
MMASNVLADARTGKNGRHSLAGLFRQSVFGRVAGYEDVNDATRLRRDPTMRWIVGGNARRNGRIFDWPSNSPMCRHPSARASGLQRDRRSASIHAYWGFIWGIPVQ